MESYPSVFTAAVEGAVDEAVLKRIATYLRFSLGAIHGRNGKDDLYRRREAFNKAANYSHWILLIDLNHSADCAPSLRFGWIPNLSPGMSFRVVVREIESWLMADREQIAKFLEVPLSKVPQNPEQLENPKVEMVNLAKLSTCRAIRLDMVPREKSGRKVGPAYASRLIEFAINHWRPKVASGVSDSLKRCLSRLKDAMS